MKSYGIKPEKVKISDFEITALTLGETGRGRKQVILPCPGDCKLLEPGLSKSGKARLNSSSNQQGWVARISTAGAYIRGANGNVSVPANLFDQFTVIAKGYGAFGDAGRTGNWDDVVFSTLLENFLVRVKPSRGEATLLFFKDGNVNNLTFAQAEALDLDFGDANSGSLGTFFKRL